MRFEADTHSHTLASGHAYSTIKEMAAAAEAKGLKALALTEHAPKMPGTCGLFYFQNLDVVPRKCGGIRLLMGAEVNIMDETGRIDKELWDNIYNVYVKDELNLGVKQYFEQQNPAALEEMTAVMLESARKGLWQASEEQVAELSKLHTEIVNTYRPSCSGFVCDNAKLRDFIASKADAQTATQYKENISKIREAKASGSNKGVVMKKEEMNQTAENQTNTLSNVAVGIAVIIVILALILFVRKRRKSSQM